MKIFECHGELKIVLPGTTDRSHFENIFLTKVIQGVTSLEI